jgi:hypothetical protein
MESCGINREQLIITYLSKACPLLGEGRTCHPLDPSFGPDNILWRTEMHAGEFKQPAYGGKKSVIYLP